MTRNGFRVARLRVPKVRALCLLCVIRSRDFGDAGGVPQASSDYDEFLSGVRRQGTQ